MHMSDALISPTVGATFWVASLTAIAYSAKKIRHRLDESIVPLMGVLSAFVFVAQMINFTIPATGSSGHLGGGIILAAVLGPYAGFIAMASVLTVQALFFADGGLLALGTNIWNLAFYTCFVAYPLIFKPLTQSQPSVRRITVASILSVVVGLQLGAFSVVMQTLLSGKSELPFGIFIAFMLPIHLAIGIVEGIVTAGVIKYIQTAMPEILSLHTMTNAYSIKKLLISLCIAVLIIGGVLSWFASNAPDGLEWSIQKTFGKEDLPENPSTIAKVLAVIQSYTALLPDYDFRQSGQTVDASQKDEQWPNINPATSISGLFGSAIVVAIIFVVAIFIKLGKKRKSDT